MADTGSRSRWVGRVALAGWLVVGVVAVLVAPEPQPPAPKSAEVMFAGRPSAQSSARSGMFAFAQLLERLGHDVSLHGRSQPPDADIWLMLEPQFGVAAEEIDALLAWTAQGRVLIYSPPEPTLEELVRRADLAKAETEDEAAECEVVEEGEAPDETQQPTAVESDSETDSDADADAEPDRLRAAVEAATVHPAEVSGDATLFRLGTGHVVVLENGARGLSNESLMAEGIAAQLPWLRLVLRDRRRVAFDEGRLGLAEGEGFSGLLMASRFASAAKLTLVALLVFLLALFVRRLPAQPDAPAGARAFGEHIDAVGRVLGRSGRRRLSLRALVAGTRRRMGALAASPAVASVLETAAASDVSRRPATVARVAERLRRLEAEAGVGAARVRRRP